jgi:hypothetical protein
VLNEIMAHIEYLEATMARRRTGVSA